MISVNEVAENNNEKIFNKLSSLIDKKILELEEGVSEFTFYIHSNVPPQVTNMLKSAYRQNGWSITGDDQGNQLFRAIDLGFTSGVFEHLDLVSPLRKVSFLSHKPFELTDRLCSARITQDYVSAEVTSLEEDPVPEILEKFYAF